MRKNISIHFGKKFGKLLIIKQNGFYIDRKTKWKKPMVLCKCDCGNEKTISLRDIINGKIKSCSCLRAEKISSRANDIRKINFEKYIGKKFGFLTIEKEDDSHLNKNEKKYSPARAVCRCDCGREKSIKLIDVIKNKIISCSCIQRKMPERDSHRMSKTAEYGIYSKMIARCYNKNNWAYKYYGERGIRVCDRWLEGFHNFFDDMGFRPDKSLSLDRINNNEGYYKENCRWATRKEQAENKREYTAALYSYNGKKMTMKKWSDFTGISKSTLNSRLNKQKMSFEEAITKPIKKTNGRSLI